MTFLARFLIPIVLAFHLSTPSYAVEEGAGFCFRIALAAGWEHARPRVGHGLHHPTFDTRDGKSPPNLRIADLEGQGLDPVKLARVPEAKRQMIAGTYDYQADSISGQYHELTGVFLVSEGHHRLVAALEVAAETGNWIPFKRLLNHGAWSRADSPNTNTVVKLPVRAFDVPEARQKEMKRILDDMAVPWYLRFDWNYLK